MTKRLALMDYQTDTLLVMLRVACEMDQGKRARSIAEELAFRNALPAKYLNLIN